MQLLPILALVLGPGTPSDAFDSEPTWLGLDQELEQLSASFRATEDGVKVTGYLIARYENTADGPLFGFGPMDVSRFKVNNTRLTFSGQVGDYGFKVQNDLTSSTQLKDAKMWWNCGEATKVTFGRFKIPFTPRQTTSDNNLQFLDRVVVGKNTMYADRQTGIMISRDFGTFEGAVSVQDGSDGDADEYLITARADVDLIGDGVGSSRGGYGIDEETALTFGFGYFDDGAVVDGDGMTLDAVMNLSPITLVISVFDFSPGVTTVGDTKPFDFAVGYMLADDKEIAVRVEDLDDGVETQVFTATFNLYQGDAKNKWQFGVKQIESNVTDGNIIQIGRVLSF